MPLVSVTSSPFTAYWTVPVRNTVIACSHSLTGDSQAMRVYADIDGDADGFLDEDDIRSIAADLDDNSSALLIVWEDVWAKPLADEIIASGGQVIAGSRIPHQVVTEVLEAIEGNQS